MAKDPAVKMRGEDLAHAYDAVRLANKSVGHCSLAPFSALTCFPRQCYVGIYIWWVKSVTLFYLSLCLCQASGESAAKPAGSVGGGAGSSAVPAQSGSLWLFLCCTATGMDLLRQSSVLHEGYC